MIIAALQEELLAMQEEDLRVRAELVSDGSLFDGYHPRMEEVHVRNARRLEEICARHGWPGRTLVGEKGTEAAWRIVQHAISLPAFQRKCLELLQEAVANQEAPPWQPAYLLDRILVFEGKFQVYGTQFDIDEHDEMSPRPIEDPAGVNARRAAIGLDSIEERTGNMRAQARNEKQKPPADRASHVRKYHEWLKRVGWRE